MSTPLPCIVIIVLLEPTFLFFVLTSGRPLPVTTFFVFSKPLCSHFAAQIVIREFSAPLQKRCLSLSKGFPLQPKFAAAAAQRFYCSFVVLLEAILQRCSSAARFVRVRSWFCCNLQCKTHFIKSESRDLSLWTRLQKEYCLQMP